MKKILLQVISLIAICNFAFAQSSYSISVIDPNNNNIYQTLNDWPIPLVGGFNMSLNSPVVSYMGTLIPIPGLSQGPISSGSIFSLSPNATQFTWDDGNLSYSFSLNALSLLNGSSLALLESFVYDVNDFGISVGVSGGIFNESVGGCLGA